MRSYGRTEEILKSCGSLRGRSISSCSSSRTSDDEDRYETADSGWSSDGVSRILKLKYIIPAIIFCRN